MELRPEQQIGLIEILSSAGMRQKDLAQLVGKPLYAVKSILHRQRDVAVYGFAIVQDVLRFARAGMKPREISQRCTRIHNVTVNPRDVRDVLKHYPLTGPPKTPEQRVAMIRRLNRIARHAMNEMAEESGMSYRAVRDMWLGRNPRSKRGTTTRGTLRRIVA